MKLRDKAGLQILLPVSHSWKQLLLHQERRYCVTSQGDRIMELAHPQHRQGWVFSPKQVGSGSLDLSRLGKARA